MYDHDRREDRFPAGRVYEVQLPAPDQSAEALSQMHEYLANRRLDFEMARYNGWYPSRAAGDDLLRIVMPCSLNKWGYYWQARAVEHTSGVPYGVAKMRYQSPHAPREEALGRLFTRHASGEGMLLVTEGPTDGLVGTMLGMDAIFLMGLTPPVAAKVKLASIARGYKVIVFLADADGYKGMMENLVYLAGLGFRTRLVSPPPGCKDLAEGTEEERAAWLKTLSSE